MVEVIGVSGGPDSMALLDMERKKGRKIVVCHVNYEHRDTADRDEQIVRDYCEKYGIKLEAVHAKDPAGNFQAWARKFRYDFFEETAKKYGADRVLIAHQQDDALETYLFQKQRNMLCEWYGLKAQGNWKSISIYRPLLAYTKEQLEEYCIQNVVPYGIDESNLSDDYARNRIRHHVLGNCDRTQLLSEISERNREQLKRIKDADKQLAQSDLDWLSSDDGWFILDWFLAERTGIHRGKDELMSLCTQLNSDCVINLNDWRLQRYRGTLEVREKKASETLVVDSIDELQNVRYGSWRFDKKGETIESISLHDDDFPLTIRTAKPGDAIQLRFGRKRLSRHFIDRHIPPLDRLEIPVVENASGTVIFVAGLGCDLAHFSTQPDIFMIKF